MAAARVSGYLERAFETVRNYEAVIEYDESTS
jgi:hypothetical protein